MLTAKYLPCFERDVKRLARKHLDMHLLYEIVDLILQDTRESKRVLKQRHDMHRLKGEWAGSNECHVANIGDWLVIWKTGNGLAVFQRTGTHDDLFR